MEGLKLKQNKTSGLTMRHFKVRDQCENESKLQGSFLRLTFFFFLGQVEFDNKLSNFFKLLNYKFKDANFINNSIITRRRGKKKKKPTNHQNIQNSYSSKHPIL